MRDCGGQLHCAKCDLPVKDVGKSYASLSGLIKSPASLLRSQLNSQASQRLDSSLDAEKADLPSTPPLLDTVACNKIMHLTEATVYQKMQQCQQKLAVTNVGTGQCTELLSVIGYCARTLQSLEWVRQPVGLRSPYPAAASYLKGGIWGDSTHLESLLSTPPS